MHVPRFFVKKISKNNFSIVWKKLYFKLKLNLDRNFVKSRQNCFTEFSVKPNRASNNMMHDDGIFSREIDTQEKFREMNYFAN